MQAHPNVHQPWSQWSEDQTLHIVGVYFNPFRFETRRKLFTDFCYHMTHCPNVSFWPVEIAFGERPFEVTSAENGQHIQLRSSAVLWHKETAINIAMKWLPGGWKYAGYVDGDFTFTRHDWALEAVHQLQHYPLVQLYSAYSPLGPTRLPIDVRPSYAYVYRNYPLPPVSGGCGLPVSPGHRSPPFRKLIDPGATGGGWVWRRNAFSAVGGLLDVCIMGSADWHMAFGVTGERVKIGEHQCSNEYNSHIEAWHKRACSVINGSIGYVEQYAVHPWHGSFSSRGYGHRWMIQRDNNFDPDTDLERDHQGLWKWAGNKPKLEDEVTQYFISRSEDSTENERGTMV